VVDTLGNAYLQQSAITSASATETGAVKKRNKYSSLSSTHDFFSSGTRNTWTHECQHPGVLGTNRKAFDQGYDGPCETMFFFQRLSVTVQRFNASCLANTYVVRNFRACIVTIPDIISVVQYFSPQELSTGAIINKHMNK